MYHITYGLLYLVSLLPLRVLYLLSSFFYVIIYYVIGYRKRVVMENLSIAFPSKTEAEKIKIAKKFYLNFIDSFIEAIKMFSASEQYIHRHFTGNWEVVNAFHKTGRSCQILLGHTFNWEWGNYAAGKKLTYKFLGVYMPIENKVLDKVFYTLRSKGETHLLAATRMKQDMMQHRNTQYALALAADQNPGGPDRAFWLNFFNKPAPFVTGPERGSVTGNLPTFFCFIEKPRRGYYNLVLSVGEENPASLERGELTLRFARYLESVITSQPDMWLWSHRRWKHKWNENYREMWIDKEEPA